MLSSPYVGGMLRMRLGAGVNRAHVTNNETHLGATFSKPSHLERKPSRRSKGEKALKYPID